MSDPPPPGAPPALPWLFTCRHGAEGALGRELRRAGLDAGDMRTLCPGLVRVEALGAPGGEGPGRWDPAWALQVLPAAATVRGESIRALAEGIAACLQDRVDGVGGPWDLHVLVPGQLKGNPRPPMARRAALVRAAALRALARTRRRACRAHVEGAEAPVALAQAVLLEVDRLWVSWSPCAIRPAGGRWPSRLPAGLAPVPDDPAAPSSAFRKLEEALSCMERWPGPGQRAVDLGASPGGWTRVLRRRGARVTAVDRSPLSPPLMADEGVRFVRGDAFAFVPPEPVDWLVSDIIARPERVAELLRLWCGRRLADAMVVQMKFKGDPDLDALDAALGVAREGGYGARARHFFNDKNEVTLMLRMLSTDRPAGF